MSNRPQNIVILGSTGSIGLQTLQVVDQHPDKFKVVGLAARDEVEILCEQARRYLPQQVAVFDNSSYIQMQRALGNQFAVKAGIEGICELAAMDKADTIVVAVSGAVGILPTITAIKRGKRIALANKETLVAAGDLVMELARSTGAMIIPVDSEHSAIFQCLGGEHKFLRNLWLTASGGPFRDFSRPQLQQVTVSMALQHPNWQMGPKITVDSASMMNKGLEVIEAHHLFSVEYEHIKVVIQRESVIHSMVEFKDGSFLGHLGKADMRIPIQYALSYPDRYVSPVEALDFAKLGCIHFEEPDTRRFPLLAAAYSAGIQGGTMPAVMNAANEVAVQGFLQGDLGFLGIGDIVQEVMTRHQLLKQPNLEEIFAADDWARETCRGLIRKGDR